MSSICSIRVALAIIAIFGFFIITVKAGPYSVPRFKLCSRGLSDALYLICKDRGGYNEPISYSDEDYSQQSSGPGLVEECCHQACTLKQLEQYCKAASGKKDPGSPDGIEESLRIIHLPETFGQ